MATSEPTPPTSESTPPPPAPPRESPLSVGSQSDVLDEHPELLVAGAFLGGLVLAQVIRKLGPS